MKKPDISRWAYNNNMECLLVFANLIDEITFNYTTDSYKAPALHVMSLMRELLQTLENIEKGVISQQAQTSVILELKWVIEHDEVFNAIVEDKKLSGLIHKINDGCNRTELKTSVEMIVDAISNEEYLQRLKVSISTLVKGNRQKEKIEKQLRLLITHLKYMGYSEEFIYCKNKEYFFSSDSWINSVDCIDAFLDFFTGNSAEYKVIHIGSNIASQIRDSLVLDGGAVDDDFDIGVNNNRIADFKRKRPRNWKFIITTVNAKDVYAARIAAEEKISTIANLFAFYHHKNTLQYHDVCLVVDSTNPINAIKIKKPIPNIVRCKDLKPVSAARLFLNAANHIQMEQDSYIRITKSLRLHQAALTADSLENQFVNLFTALEILIPKEPDSGKDRIIQIYDTLIPYLCLGYYDKLITSVMVSLKQWDETMLNHIEQTVVEGTTVCDKVCAYMLLQKYDNDIDSAVYPALTNDHYILLRHRMNRLHVMMEKPSELLKHIKHHEQKLKWHIDRIYRTRNLIVHAGISPHYLETLLENIHSYYDILISRLIYDNINKGFKKLEYSYLMYDVEYKNYLGKLNQLREDGDTLDENNLLSAVLLHN